MCPVALHSGMASLGSYGVTSMVNPGKRPWWHSPARSLSQTRVYISQHACVYMYMHTFLSPVPRQAPTSCQPAEGKLRSPVWFAHGTCHRPNTVPTNLRPSPGHPRLGDPWGPGAP